MNLTKTLTNKLRLGMMHLQQGKCSAVRFRILPVKRCSDSRTTNAAFSMVRCTEAPEGAPFRLAVMRILCHLAARASHLSGQFIYNKRRALMSAINRTISELSFSQAYDAIVSCIEVVNISQDDSVSEPVWQLYCEIYDNLIQRTPKSPTEALYQFLAERCGDPCGDADSEAVIANAKMVLGVSQ